MKTKLTFIQSIPVQKVNKPHIHCLQIKRKNGCSYSYTPAGY